LKEVIRKKKMCERTVPFTVIQVGLNHAILKFETLFPMVMPKSFFKFQTSCSMSCVVPKFAFWFLVLRRFPRCRKASAQGDHNPQNEKQKRTTDETHKKTSFPLYTAKMYIVPLKAPYLLIASLARRRVPSMIVSTPISSTRLMASSAASSQEPVVFPVWLRLQGIAPFAERQRVTSQVGESISVSGGFLSRFNMLSDMVTVMTLEDVQPAYIGSFQQSLQKIDGFRLDAESIHRLENCQTLLQQVAENSTKQDVVRIPPAVYCNLQICWVGAPGKLRQEIPAVDG
jgi:hypothetical protein